MAVRLHKERRLRVVHHRHAAPGEEPALELHVGQDGGERALAVQRPLRPEKVFLVLRQDGDAVDDEIRLVERPARPFERQARRLETNAAVRPPRPVERHLRHLAIDERQRRPVFERPIRAPLAAHHAVGERRETRVAQGDGRSETEGVGRHHMPSVRKL